MRHQNPVDTPKTAEALDKVIQLCVKSERQSLTVMRGYPQSNLFGHENQPMVNFLFFY